VPEVDSLLHALRDPQVYPWPVTSVKMVETHISWVFLAGDRVIKLKRPVQYAFVDYSTLQKRRQACEDEVALNRRLAPDVYLGVIPIIREGRKFRIGTGEGGDIVEWATLMRRLDDDDMLDAQLQAGMEPPQLAARLAERLVPFHLEEIPECPGDPDAILNGQLGVVTDNLNELQPFLNRPLPSYEFDLINRAMQRFIGTNRRVLRQRVVDGWIREGHGDLRCEHVSIPADGPLQIYDCVEFNRDLRCADVASDLAFLLMDLARLGAQSGTIRDLIGAYQRAGAVLPSGLLRFYWIHRALVRAKVHSLQLADAKDTHEEQRISVKVMEYLHVATRQAVKTQPAVIAMTGLSGTGKSTVGKALAQALGATRIASDEVRKTLAGPHPNEDIYSAEWTDRTYRKLNDLADEAVASGNLVILDATYLDSERRLAAADVATTHDVPFLLIETVTDDDVVVQRLEERQRRGDSVSDATVDIYRWQREQHLAEPPVIPPGAITIQVDTTPDGPTSLDTVLSALEDAGLLMPQIGDVRIIAT